MNTIQETTIYINMDAQDALATWECQRILAPRPEINYDESLFWEVCRQMGYGPEASKWACVFTSRTTMNEMVRTIPVAIRIPFTRKYVEVFDRAMQI